MAQMVVTAGIDVSKEWLDVSLWPTRAGLRVERSVAGHHRLDAVRAHLLERAGDREAAIASYELAASRTTSLPEQRYLLARAARLR